MIMEREKTSFSRAAAVLVPLGLLAVAAATLIPVYRGTFDAGAFPKWLYCAGAVLLLVCRLFTPYKGKDLRLCRLYRIESWSALFFCVGGFFMWYPSASVRDWLAFTLAGAAIQIYTSFAIPSRQKRLKSGQ